MQRCFFSFSGTECAGHDDSDRDLEDVAIYERRTRIAGAVLYCTMRVR